MFSKVFELIFSSFFVQFSPDILVQSLLRDLIIPFPLEIHGFSLLLSHKTDREFLEIYHREFLIFSSSSCSKYWVVFFATPPQFWFTTVQIKSVSQLGCCFPAVPSWIATAYNMVSSFVCLRSLGISFMEIMNINIFDLIKFQKLYDFINIVF